MADFPSTIEVTEGNKDEASLVIAGRTFKFWEDFSITFSFDKLANSFSITTPFNPEFKEFRDSFRPYNFIECAFYLNGQKVLTGTLIKPNTRTTSNSRQITIEGYSFPGVLQDCNASIQNWPIVYRGLNLQEIAEDLAAPFDIDVIFEADPGAKFSNADKVDLNATTKIYEFLKSLARQRGLVIGNNNEGAVVFKQTTTEPADISIVEGQYPYLESGASYDGQKRFSEIVALQTEMKKGPGEYFEVIDGELEDNNINRPFIFSAPDTNKGGLKAAAIAQWGRLISDSMSLNVDLVGFFDKNGRLWKDDRKIIYQSDGDMIYNETEFLIREATLNRTSSSSTTSLNLVFPDAYNGGVVKKFPWQE